jgi:hypothetical protein
VAYELQLPGWLEAARWKAKIRDRERVEPPHVTILHKTRCWRIGLRDGEFLDEEPPPKEVPDELVDYVREHLSTLIEEWDAMYPHNPVSSAS